MNVKTEDVEISKERNTGEEKRERRECEMEWDVRDEY